jgi:hypothetical protein
VKLIVTEDPDVLTTLRLVGGRGTDKVLTDEDAIELDDVPTELVAVAVNV